MVTYSVPEILLIDLHKLSPVSLKIGLINISHDIIMKKIINMWFIVTYVLHVKLHERT